MYDAGVFTANNVFWYRSASENTVDDVFLKYHQPCLNVLTVLSPAVLGASTTQGSKNSFSHRGTFNFPAELLSDLTDSCI